MSIGHRPTEPLTILRNLFLPRACVGCGDPDTWWCPSCDVDVSAVPPLVVPVADTMLCAAASYQQPVRDLVLGLKEQQLTALAGPAGRLLEHAIRSHPDLSEATALVPVPASARSWRLRGFDLLNLVMAAPAPLPVVQCLSWSRRPRAQKSLARSDRVVNVAGALTSAAVPQRVLVIDDVVTTGATVAEAIRAIVAGGGTVVGVASIAHTPAAVLVRADPLARTGYRARPFDRPIRRAGRHNR